MTPFFASNPPCCNQVGILSGKTNLSGMGVYCLKWGSLLFGGEKHLR